MRALGWPLCARCRPCRDALLPSCCTIHRLLELAPCPVLLPAGGLVKYIRNARQLLKDSKEGEAGLGRGLGGMRSIHVSMCLCR